TFQLAYSTDGTTFNNVGSTYVIPSGVTWTSGTANPLDNTSFSYDLSSITALNNVSAVYFRIVDSATTSINGSTASTSGTDRVDNFTVTSVPEPSILALAAMGGTAFLTMFRRKS
ncbi:MAG TPA: PEP-CTERM sorting domain-containing protein, partial [Verrucomicrobiae bacterium]